jgi:hypothetical protein
LSYTGAPEPGVTPVPVWVVEVWWVLVLEPIKPVPVEWVLVLDPVRPVPVVW